MKHVIITLDDAEFFQNTLTAIYNATEHTMTRSKREAFNNKLEALAYRIEVSENYDSDGYHQETLEDLYTDDS